MNEAFLDHPRPLILVHRSLGFERPENTLEAIGAAIQAGFYYIETDVQTTQDGVAVLFHDRSLERIFGMTRRIRDVSFAELKSVEFQDICPVPSLIEVLRLHPIVRLNLDLKDHGSGHAVAEAVATTHSWNRVCISSFSDRRLNRFRPLAPPSVPIGMGWMRSLSFVLTAPVPPLRPLARRLAAGRDVIHLPVLSHFSAAYRRIVEVAHEEGLSIYAWTINSSLNMERVLDLGFDGLVTDAPQRLKAVIASRAERPE
jgi:Glycerophosphoryl diester phosphodiesterase